MEAIKSIMLLQSLADFYEAACKPVCHKSKLSQTALDILMFLAANPECDTAKDISKYRGIKASIVSFNVERLVGEGYLERHEVPGDRRKIRLVCTEKAADLVREGEQTAEKFYRAILEGMKEEDIDRFERVMAMLCHNARQLGHDPSCAKRDDCACSRILETE